LALWNFSKGKCFLFPVIVKNGVISLVPVPSLEEELAKINDFAKSDSSSRSGFIRRATLDIRKLREKAGDWNGVAEIRKWRETR